MDLHGNFECFPLKCKGKIEKSSTKLKSLGLPQKKRFKDSVNLFVKKKNITFFYCNPISGLLLLFGYNKDL